MIEKITRALAIILLVQVQLLVLLSHHIHLCLHVHRVSIGILLQALANQIIHMVVVLVQLNHLVPRYLVATGTQLIVTVTIKAIQELQCHHVQLVNGGIIQVAHVSQMTIPHIQLPPLVVPVTIGIRQVVCVNQLVHQHNIGTARLV